MSSMIPRADGSMVALPGSKLILLLEGGPGADRHAVLLVDDLDIEFLSLAQLVGQQLRDTCAGFLVAGTARNAHGVGRDDHCTVRQVAQRFQTGQHPGRPVGGQDVVDSCGGMDAVAAEQRLRVGCGKVARRLVADPPAQLHQPFRAESGDEFRWSGGGIFGLWKHGLEREDVGQGILQFAHDIIEKRLPGAFRGQQRDIRVRKGNRPAAQLGNGCYGFLGRFGPAR